MNNMLKIKELIKSYAGLILVVFHVVGLFLLGGEWRGQLVVLTPLNLLLLAGLYLYASKQPTVKWAYYLPIFLGFIIELVGTNTGFPFGAYSYGTALGPGIMGTPVMIGILWWVLIRSFYDLTGVRFNAVWIRSILTGLAMTAMDVLIEPVAIELTYWQWDAVTVPIENYLAWFVLSTLFARLTASGDVRNPLSIWVIVVLSVFFFVLGSLYAMQ